MHTAMKVAGENIKNTQRSHEMQQCCLDLRIELTCAASVHLVMAQHLPQEMWLWSGSA